MTTRNDAESTIFHWAIIQMNSNIEHWHDPVPQEQISWTIRVPTHMCKRTVGDADVMIINQTVLLRFRNASLMCCH